MNSYAYDIISKLLLLGSLAFAIINCNLAEKRGRNGYHYLIISLILTLFLTGVGPFLIFLLLLILPKKAKKEPDEAKPEE